MAIDKVVIGTIPIIVTICIGVCLHTTCTTHFNFCLNDQGKVNEWEIYSFFFWGLESEGGGSSSLDGLVTSIQTCHRRSYVLALFKMLCLV